MDANIIIKEKTGRWLLKKKNFMKKQTLPKWIVVWWWIAIICATPLYLRLLWEQTLLTWKHGLQMVGWTIVHNHTVFFLFGIIGYLLVFTWIPSTGIYILIKRKRLTKSIIFYFAIPLIAIVLGLVPYGFWASLGGIK